MKIKKGDNVILLTGTDRGKTGKVVEAFPKKNQVVVEGLNMKKKNQKARRKGETGQVISMAFPVHVSNVKLVKEVKK